MKISTTQHLLNATANDFRQSFRSYKTISLLSVTIPLLIMTGCSGDPNVNIQKGIEKVSEQWNSRRDIKDPEKRQAFYESLVADLNKLSSKYPETDAGRRIANRQALSNLDTNQIYATADRLASRAACYSEPTIACLTPFTTEEYAGNSPSQNTDPASTAKRLICSNSLEEADKALDPIKINAPRYRNELIQLSFAAVDCGKSVEIPSILKLGADTLSNDKEKIDYYLTTLNTNEFSAAHKSLSAVVESLLSIKLNAQTKANATLNLALYYAKAGESEKSLTKAKYILNDLNFDIGFLERQTIATAAALNKDIKSVEFLSPNQRIKNSFILQALRKATISLATNKTNKDLGFYKFYSDQKQSIRGVLETYAEPQSALDSIAFLDRSLTSLLGKYNKREILAHGHSLGEIYSYIAFIYERLDKKELADKYVALATENRNPEKSVLGVIAFNRGDFDKAQKLIYEGGYKISPNVLVAEIAATGDVNAAVAIANKTGGNTLPSVVTALADNGFTEKSYKLLLSLPEHLPERQGLAWNLANKAAEKGNVQQLEALIQEFNLENGNYRNKIHVPIAFAKAHAVAKDKPKAIEYLEKARLVGEEMDKGSNSNVWGQSSRKYEAQNASRLAFDLGYTETGFSLFRRTTNRNQQPLQAAISNMKSSNEIQNILMAAHDELDLRNESIVINHLVNWMKKRNSSN